MAHRFAATRGAVRWVALAEAVAWSGRTRYHAGIRRLLDTDPSVRRFMDGETDILPEVYRARMQRQLGPLHELLPQEAFAHDHLAYLHGAGERAG
jgi:hypothetical protein